jgi:hypothetical protein
MNKALKITLFGVGALIAIGGSYFLYKYITKPKENTEKQPEKEKAIQIITVKPATLSQTKPVTATINRAVPLRAGAVASGKG